MKAANFSDRLAQALSEANMRASTLSELCSVSKSTISNYLSGKFEAKYDRIALLAQALGCDPLWLQGQDVPKGGCSQESDEYGAGMLPLLGSVAAGSGVFAEGNVVQYEYAEPRFCDGEHFYLLVEGDSMSPMLSSGDMLLCRRQDTLQNGQIGVFVIDGDAGVVKAYRESGKTISLISFNQNWAPICFSGRDRERLRIVGRVMRSIRNWE